MKEKPVGKSYRIAKESLTIRDCVVRWLFATVMVSTAFTAAILSGIQPLQVIVIVLAILLPGWVEDNILGTSFLSSSFLSSHMGNSSAAGVAVMFAYFLLLTSFLLFPLIGRNWKCMARLAIYVYVLFPLITVVSRKAGDMVSHPVWVTLESPEVLVENLPFSDLPNRLRWSPDGRYIAVSGHTHPEPTTDIYKIILVDTNSRSIITQIQTSYEATDRAEWSSDGCLWLPSGDGWDVYAPPFSRPTHVSVEVIKNIKKRDWGFDSPRWEFHPDSQLVVVVSKNENKNSWNVGAWKQGKHLYDVELLPREPGGSRRLGYCAFSPDGSYLAITVVGWVEYESSGSGELWILETGTGNLSFLHKGKTKWWQMWDYPVQDVNPSWSSDNGTIVFGDDTFGIEEIDIVTKRRRRILKPGWGGEEVRLSPTSSWIGFHKRTWSTEDGFSTPMTVITHDGRTWSVVPRTYACWTMGAWDWHPQKDILAWATNKEFEEPYKLYVWRIQAKK